MKSFRTLYGYSVNHEGAQRRASPLSSSGLQVGSPSGNEVELKEGVRVLVSDTPLVTPFLAKHSKAQGCRRYILCLPFQATNLLT